MILPRSSTNKAFLSLSDLTLIWQNQVSTFVVRPNALRYSKDMLNTRSGTLNQLLLSENIVGRALNFKFFVEILNIIK